MTLTLIRTNPAVIYLAGLGATSRATEASRLKAIARILTDGQKSAREIAWHKLDQIQIGVLRSSLQQRYSPTSANGMLTVLRSVLKACWREGLLTQEQLEKLIDFRPVPGNVMRQGRMLSDDEIEKLSKSTTNARDSALVALVFEGGLRRGEIVKLQLTDYSKRSVQVRKAKHGKTRTVPLNVAADRIEAWIAERGDWPGPLFTPIRDGKVIPKALYHTSIPVILARITRRAGVDRWSPHDGRRTYISSLLATGSDLATAAALAGHSSPNTTMRYDRRPEEARVSAVGRLRMPV